MESLTSAAFDPNASASSSTVRPNYIAMPPASFRASVPTSPVLSTAMSDATSTTLARTSPLFNAAALFPVPASFAALETTSWFDSIAFSDASSRTLFPGFEARGARLGYMA